MSADSSLRGASWTETLEHNERGPSLRGIRPIEGSDLVGRSLLCAEDVQGLTDGPALRTEAAHALEYPRPLPGPETDNFLGRPAPSGAGIGTPGSQTTSLRAPVYIVSVAALASDPFCPGGRRPVRPALEEGDTKLAQRLTQDSDAPTETIFDRLGISSAALYRYDAPDGSR